MRYFYYSAIGIDSEGRLTLVTDSYKGSSHPTKKQLNELASAQLSDAKVISVTEMSEEDLNTFESEQ